MDEQAHAVAEGAVMAECEKCGEKSIGAQKMKYPLPLYGLSVKYVVLYSFFAIFAKNSTA